MAIIKFLLIACLAVFSTALLLLLLFVLVALVVAVYQRIKKEVQRHDDD